MSKGLESKKSSQLSFLAFTFFFDKGLASIYLEYVTVYTDAYLALVTQGNQSTSLELLLSSHHFTYYVLETL